MAIVIIGGLASSTVLNLFLLPALYLRYGRDEAGVEPGTPLPVCEPVPAAAEERR